MFDYLIVGAGFAGSVIAERLASVAGKKVLVIDRRGHVGGNAYDHYNDDGLLVHKYGPHIFHTNSREVFEYLSQFTEWRQYQHRVLSHVSGQLVPIPINLDTINKLYGLNLNTREAEEFFHRVAEPRERLRTSEDVVVSKVGRDLYEKFFRNYTRKQWGLDPSELDASVTARVPTRTNRDDRYFTDSYQAMPRHGYTRMFERMLDHPNIKVMLQVDYREVERIVPHRELVFTGPVDEFFDYRFGKLPYRSLEFRHETLDREVHQPAPVVNYPNDFLYTRVTEFKYLTGQEHRKTAVVYEYPRAEGDPYYPVPRPENAELYQKYRVLAEQAKGVHFVGRLATYKYYNMDQVVAQALMLYSKLSGDRRPARPVAAEVRARCTRVLNKLVRQNTVNSKSTAISDKRGTQGISAPKGTAITNESTPWNNFDLEEVAIKALEELSVSLDVEAEEAPVMTDEEVLSELVRLGGADGQPAVPSLRSYASASGPKAKALHKYLAGMDDSV